MARSPIPSVLKSIAANSIGQYQHPSFVTFFVTWACNHRCVFCDVWKKTPEDEMSVVEIEKIFKQLKKLDVLRITGGEPYTRRDLSEIINIIDAVNDPTMIHITTNGINTRRIIKSLETLSNVSKVHIKVSIDDIGEKHDDIRGVSGAYEKAIETVRELVKFRDNYGLHVGVNQAILNESSMQSYETLKSELKNGDLIKIIGGRNKSPSLQWLSYCRTGKARASIRKYWQNKTSTNILSDKKYISSLCIKIPNMPGKLGEVSSLIGFHENNIINMEIISKKKDYLEFIFDIQIRDLKNYKNLISELKLKEYKFKVIRHRKKNAFLQRIFKNFKRD